MYVCFTRCSHIYRIFIAFSGAVIAVRNTRTAYSNNLCHARNRESENAKCRLKVFFSFLLVQLGTKLLLHYVIIQI